MKPNYSTCSQCGRSYDLEDKLKVKQKQIDSLMDEMMAKQKVNGSLLKLNEVGE